MDKPFKVNAKVRLRDPVTEWYGSRIEAASAFRRHVINAQIEYVEVWDVQEDTRTAVKLWEFEP